MLLQQADRGLAELTVLVDDGYRQLPTLHDAEDNLMKLGTAFEGTAKGIVNYGERFFQACLTIRDCVISKPMHWKNLEIPIYIYANATHMFDVCGASSTLLGVFDAHGLQLI